LSTRSSTNPKGHTQPQKTRPKSTVRISRARADEAPTRMSVPDDAMFCSVPVGQESSTVPARK